jgi:hypothetical protein
MLFESVFQTVLRGRIVSLIAQEAITIASGELRRAQARDQRGQAHGRW